MKKTFIALLLVWCVWMTTRSIVLQKRLNSLEVVLVQHAKEQDTKINAAAQMASDAVHISSGRPITPPMTIRKGKP